MSDSYINNRTLTLDEAFVKAGGFGKIILCNLNFRKVSSTYDNILCPFILLWKPYHSFDNFPYIVARILM